MGNENKRLDLILSAEAYERLLEIGRKARKVSDADTIRAALRLYDWFLDQKAAGNKFCVVKDNVARELELLL